MGAHINLWDCVCTSLNALNSSKGVFFMGHSESLMRRVLELAREGQGRVNPNPLVGALLIKDGRIIGEGAHRRFGEAHAEVEALKNVTEPPDGATLYVNLEPCTYDGKTPACVPAIIESGVSKVVIANSDPNPKVNGQGIQQLREAGLEVEVGLLEYESYEMNRGFMKAMNAGRPWMTLKLALTIDGFMADQTGNSKWITGEASREQVHVWRAEHNAILVGAGTVLTDDPALTVRAVDGPNPKRVILAGEHRFPDDVQILSDLKAPTVIIRAEDSKNGDVHSTRSVRDIYLALNQTGQFDWNEVLRTLYQEEGILSIFVEGGAQVASSLLEAEMVDELIIMTGSKITGAGLSPFQHLRRSLENPVEWNIFDVKQFQNDVCVRYRKGQR